MAKKCTFLPSKNVISPGKTTCLMILWFSSRKMILHAGLHARMRTKSRPSSFLRDIVRKIWNCIPDFAGLVRCLGPGRASYLIVGVTFNCGGAPLALSIWSGAFASPYGIGLQGLSAYEPSATACQKWQAVPACWRNARCEPSAISRSKPKRIADCSAYGTLLVADLELARV